MVRGIATNLPWESDLDVWEAKFEQFQLAKVLEQEISG